MGWGFYDEGGGGWDGELYICTVGGEGMLVDAFGEREGGELGVGEELTGCDRSS